MSQTATKSADDTMLEISARREERRNDLATVTYQGGNLFLPTNGRMLMDMANMMAQSGPMVRDIYRGNPGACMALIAVCASYNLNPIQVSWHTYKASKSDDAPVSYEAKVIVAMLQASGVELDYEFSGQIKDRTRSVKASFTDPKTGKVRAVETPPLGMISPQNSPLWKSDPDQQLCYYAGRAWGRRYKPGLLLGIVSDDEELPAIGPDNARDVTPATPRRGGYVYADPAPARAAPQDIAEAEAAQEEEATAEEPAQHNPVTGEIVDDAPAAPQQDTSAPANGRQIDYDKIARSIRRSIADGQARRGIETAFMDELEAIAGARPDLHAAITAELDAIG